MPNVDRARPPTTGRRVGEDALGNTYYVQRKGVGPLGVPRRWVQRIRAALKSIGPRFNAGRMVSEYLKRVY